MPLGWRLLLLLSFGMGGCASSLDLPLWFDSIHRVPVHSLTVNGHRIAYLDQGQGPAIILLHGYGGSMWQWEYQQIPLTSHYRVITPDLLGSGLSDKPDIDYTPDELVSSVQDLMAALGIQHATVVGNSMGGGVAIGMALTHPERVDRLILIDGLPDRVRERLASPLMRHAVDSQLPLWVVRLANWMFGSIVTEKVLKEIVYDHRLLTPAVLDRSNRNRALPGLLGPLITIRGSLPAWESGFGSRLNQVSRPTLILWGEHDKLFPPAVGRDLQAAIPGAMLKVIPDAGHMPQWEQPDVVNRHILSFLQP
jgi:pimeloyl-ACP methyl ester carboxylesterase